jgi:hypothetical protein
MNINGMVALSVLLRDNLGHRGLHNARSSRALLTSHAIISRDRDSLSIELAIFGSPFRRLASDLNLNSSSSPLLSRRLRFRLTEPYLGQSYGNLSLSRCFHTYLWTRLLHSSRIFAILRGLSAHCAIGMLSPTVTRKSAAIVCGKSMVSHQGNVKGD